MKKSGEISAPQTATSSVFTQSRAANYVKLILNRNTLEHSVVTIRY